MRGTSLFYLDYNIIVHFQTSVILLAIYHTLAWYHWTDCSKTRPSHRTEIIPIHIYPPCCLLVGLVLDSHTCKQCKNKFQLPRPYQISRIGLVYSIEPLFFFTVNFVIYDQSLCFVMSCRIGLCSADTYTCLPCYLFIY